MKLFLFPLLFTTACLEPMPPYPVVASDEDPGYCSENYPFEEAPTMCESNSYGDCCSWEIEQDGGEECRYDYCSYHGTGDCTWELQYKSCGGE